MKLRLGRFCIHLGCVERPEDFEREALEICRSRDTPKQNTERYDDVILLRLRSPVN